MGLLAACISHGLGCTWQSMRLIGDGAESFTKNCVVGIKANDARISQIMREVCSNFQDPLIFCKMLWKKIPA